MEEWVELRRLAWQCRRGMLELDELLLAFLRHRYSRQPESIRAAFHRLLFEDDHRLYRWLFEAPGEAPAAYRELIDRIRRTDARGASRF